MPAISTEIKMDRAQQERDKPRYSESTLAAMEEARKISRDPHVPGHDDMEELRKALNEE